MKKKIKIIIFILLILIITYTVAQFKLKNILARELSKNLKRQVYIGKVGLELPLHAYVKNLVIFETANEGEPLSQFVRINEIQISPAILPVFKGKLLLRAVYIVRPVINIVKLDKNRFNFSDLLYTGSGSTETKGVRKEMPVLLLKLRVKSGEINFIDKTVGKTPVELTLKNLNFHIAKLVFPLTDIATRYDLKAKIQENGLKELADFHSSGWFNFTKKEMEAKFSLNSLGLAYLSPYFRKTISESVDAGVLNFYSDIVSVNNDLTAKCRMEIEGLKITSSSAMILGVPVDTFLTSLKDSGGKLSFDFEVKTKFDQPRINLAQLSGGILSKALERVVLESPGIILNIGEKTGETGVKDVGKELKDIGEGLKKILGK